MWRKDARDTKTEMKDGGKGEEKAMGTEEARRWRGGGGEGEAEGGATSSMRGRTRVRSDNKTKLDELQVVIREGKSMTGKMRRTSRRRLPLAPPPPPPTPAQDPSAATICESRWQFVD